MRGEKRYLAWPRLSPEVGARFGEDWYLRIRSVYKQIFLLFSKTFLLVIVHPALIALNYIFAYKFNKTIYTTCLPFL